MIYYVVILVCLYYCYLYVKDGELIYTTLSLSKTLEHNCVLNTVGKKIWKTVWKGK